MNLSRVIRHINTRPVGERNLLVPDDDQPRQRSYSLKVPYAAPHKLQSERRWTRKWSTVRRKKEDKVEEVVSTNPHQMLQEVVSTSPHQMLRKL